MTTMTKTKAEPVAILTPAMIKRLTEMTKEPAATAVADDYFSRRTLDALVRRGLVKPLKTQRDTYKILKAGREAIGA